MAVGNKTATEAAPGRRLRRLTPVAVAVLLLGIGIGPRLESRTALRTQTQALAAPTVSVVYPSAGQSVQHIQLPVEVQPYQETQIFARTNGYLAHWYTDIGTHVTSGQRLADIQTPEIDAQLLQARADMSSARERYEISRVTAKRWTELLKSNAVPRQQTEQDVATMKADLATLEATRANVRRLQELQSYEKVVAPFPGVVTARNVDVGALINAGSTMAPGSALFHLVETDKLRVFGDVPQEFADEVRPGTPATLTLSQLPGRSFTGTVTRTAGALDSSNRTLRIEVDVDNQDATILPGSYAMMDLALTASQPRPTLPINALLFRPQGVQIAVVNSHGKVQLQTITLGHDFGTNVEIASGLQGNERVIVNPNDAIVAGEVVRVVASTGKPS